MTHSNQASSVGGGSISSVDVDDDFIATSNIPNLRGLSMADLRKVGAATRKPVLAAATQRVLDEDASELIIAMFNA